jgi:hypothetical protein
VSIGVATVSSPPTVVTSLQATVGDGDIAAIAIAALSVLFAFSQAKLTRSLCSLPISLCPFLRSVDACVRGVQRLNSCLSGCPLGKNGNFRRRFCQAPVDLPARSTQAPLRRFRRCTPRLAGAHSSSLQWPVFNGRDAVPLDDHLTHSSTP